MCNAAVASNARQRRRLGAQEGRKDTTCSQGHDLPDSFMGQEQRFSEDTANNDKDID